MEKIPMTESGYAALDAELKRLKTEERPAIIAAIGRMGVNVAYNSGAQYAAELIPTEVRGQGVAAVHVAGYAATFFSSYILYLV